MAMHMAFLDLDLEVRAGDSLPAGTAPACLDLLDWQGLKQGMKPIFRCTGIEETCHQHVAGDTSEEIEMDAHRAPF